MTNNQIITTGPGYVVIDNFLSPDDHKLVWNYIQSERFEFVHSKRWCKAFRLTDGQPLFGPVYISDKYEPDHQSTVYPSNSGIDIVIKAVKDIISQFADLVGEKDKDWAYFFARAYLYGINTGLSWHRDNEHNATGAFTYYAHPEWYPRWGGEFLLAPYETKHVQFPKSHLYNKEHPQYLGSHFDTEFEKEVLNEHSIGTYIIPKPNRLLLLTSGIIHCIKKVDPAIGDKVRATIQGFFQDPVGLLKK